MFENLLQLAADEDKATLTQMATKYPNLKKNFELGESLEKLQPRIAALQYQDPEAAVSELEKWREFKQTNWPAWEQKHQRVEAAFAEAQARIAELEARSADMTAEEMKEILKSTMKEMGVVTTPELQTQMAEFVNKNVSPTLDSRINGLTTRFEDVFDKIESVVQTHQSEFKEALRPKAIFDYMKEHKIADPEAAYKEMTAGKYQEKSAAQLAAEKKAEYEKGIADGKKAALETIGNQRNPVDGKGGSLAPRGGTLMRRAEARMPKDGDGKTDTSKIPLGKGVHKAATQEYLEKQMAGAVQ